MAELTLETLRAELDAAIERGLALVHARLNAIQRNGDEIRKEVRRLRSKLQSFEEAQASLATSGDVESLGDGVDRTIGKHNDLEARVAVLERRLAELEAKSR